MNRTPTTDRSSSASRPGEALAGGGRALVAALMLVGGVACGPAEQNLGGPMEPLAVEELEETGIITNGIITNGIITNGIITNGLVTSGLSTVSLNSASFTTWFNQELSRSPMFMQYVVRCALPSAQTRVYTNPTTGITYTWPGGLGLAPGWASGSAATLTEQQLVSACVAAHTNKYGVHVTLSMLGNDASGAPLTVTTAEMNTYAERESCFFGNLFTGGQGVLFAGNDRNYLRPHESTLRACGLSQLHGSTDCAPITHVGSCTSYCTLDATGTFYTSCTYNGVTYKPLTTRIREQDIFSCGDGVCQQTERCGNGSTFDSCYADCGACPAN
ncbi:hypothetical protein P2318_04510 [Myxococcaceae bacterium GXIMD 01537]